MSPGEFTRRLLGRTGLEVGRLGLGSSYGAPAEAIERAYDAGCNYLYWGSMRRPGFGKAVRNICRRDRDNLVLVLQTYARVAGLMPSGAKRGLRALKTDHADVLLLGWFQQRPSDALMEAALRLKEQGLVRFLAMSTHNRLLAGELAAEPAADQPIDILHVRYNAAHRGAEREVFPHLPEDRSTGPGLVTFNSTRWGSLLTRRSAYPRHLKGPPASTEVYRFAMSNPAPDVVIAGPADAEQLDLALAALGKGPLSPDELAQVQAWGDAVHANPPFRLDASVFSRF
jgi:aryl-alcohol dehydrogenase-like predicted oxidoreductase